MEESSSTITLNDLNLKETAVIMFFQAVKIGDLDSVVQLIDSHTGSNLVNMENQEGKTSLEVAMENNNYEIAKCLINNGFKLKTTLLRMIENDNPVAVTFICEHKDIIQEWCHNIMESTPVNDEYTMETTPMLLAAEKNNYRIVQILLNYGASMPTYEEFNSRYTAIPDTSITYRYYNAITSEAYLLQTRGNIVTNIFNLFKQLKRAKHGIKGTSDEFEKLTTNLEMVALKVLNLTRNQEEVRCLLAGDNDAVQSPCHPMPRVIEDAMLLEMKGFVAHDKCQEVLTDLWYQHLHSDLQHSVSRRIMATVLLTILYHLPCILYVIFPCETIRRFMKVPYVKFTMYTACRIALLVQLISAALNTYVTKIDPVMADATDEEIREGYLIFRNSTYIALGFNLLLLTWILGISLHEVSNARRMGREMYMKIGCNVFDIVQLGFYWISIVFHFVAFVQAQQTVRDKDWIRCQRPPSPHSTPFPTPPTSCRDCNPPTSQLPLIANRHGGENVTHGDVSTTGGTIDNSTYSRTMESFQMTDSHLEGDKFKEEKPCPQISIIVNIHGLTEHVAIFGSHTRYDWKSYDPLLVSEAAFALANVLTFGRLLQIVVMVSGRLGVLAISINGMVGDIVKFLLLFSMAWISFTLGMTQLYRPFDELKLQECQESICPTPAFISIFDSMKTLFWALFGLHDLDDLQIEEGKLGLTEAVGHFMYALYLLLAVIVLLNALIAMMSSTYTKVQENAEMEWKYIRSTMMTEYIIEGAVLPPPFNLIPDVWQFLRCSRQRQKVETTNLKNHHNRFQETCEAVTKRYIYKLQREKTHCCQETTA